MAESDECLGHFERVARRNKIEKFLASSPIVPDENMKLLIKKGPKSEEISLRELEVIYVSKPEWKIIEDGGVLSVPVEEFRMNHAPKPNRSGKVEFVEKKGKGAGNQIENYSVALTEERLEGLVLTKYNEVKEKVKHSGASDAKAEREAISEATRLPQFQALKTWQDINAEITLKQAIKEMVAGFNMPALLVRSVDLKAMSALKDLGLKLSGDAEIDLVLAFATGDFLNVVICEVKRADTYPWKTECSLPNKRAVNKAEIQLTKDFGNLKAILTGISPGNITFHTLACFPEASSSELQAIFCSSCLDTRIVSKDDLMDLSLLQKKTQVRAKPDPATTSSKKNLLTITARLLSHHSILHIGYREVQDKEKLVDERHKHNLKCVDGKLMQKEFIIASP